MPSAVSNVWGLVGGVKTALTLNARTQGTPYDVIVPIIQSNMRGVADDYDSSDQFNDARVQMWDWPSSSIVPASEVMSTQETTTGMGASNTFIKDYVANRLATGRKALVVNTARGGTGFSLPSTNTTAGVAMTAYTWDRTAADDSNNLALRTIERLKAIMATLPSGSRIVAYLANHGSTDGTNNMTKELFKADLIDWISFLRSRMATPSVPYLMMQMRPDLIANENRHKIIDDAQLEVATSVAGVYRATSPVGSSYYRSDSVHFNALGQRTIGHSLYGVLPA